MSTNIRDKAIISLASALVSLSVFAQSTDQNYVKVDKYLFGGGYAQASVASATTDNFAFYSHGVGSFDHYDKIIMSLINDANNSLSGIGMQIVFKRTGSDTDSYNLKVVR